MKRRWQRGHGVSAHMKHGDAVVERLLERALPLLGAHPRRVGRELAEAGEQLLAGLVFA